MNNAKVRRWYCGGHKRVNGIACTVPIENYLLVMNQTFPGYTVYQTRGMWEGTEEPSFVFEVIDHTPRYAEYMRDIAWLLREAGGQEEVMYTVADVACGSNCAS